jgi:Lrp/AsnC family transcriptional regulator, regulator for asnA, asnC and gidA
MYFSTCTGRANLCLQLVCKDHEQLYELLTRRVPAIGGITETETFIELRVHKANYVYTSLDGQTSP